MNIENDVWLWWFADPLTGISLGLFLGVLVVWIAYRVYKLVPSAVTGAG